VGRQTGAGGFEKLVVIKRLLPHLAEDAHFVAMLLDEARIAARLSHPNVCQVYDLGQAEGNYYIAMEHLEGVPASLILRNVRRAGQRLDIGLAGAILRQTCDGLHHAHELADGEGNSVGLVHRDVSPSNLFVTAGGLVKVLDFGVAKSQDALARTHTGALKGKYAYMSPEQVLGNPVDRRADVFSLGVVLFELLTAQRLFWRDSEYKMFQAIVEDSIPSLMELRPGLPPAIAQVAERALSRDPDQRFASAQEMGEILDEALAASGGPWKSSAIAEYVNQNFAATIEEKRHDVQAGIAQANRLKRDPQLSDPALVIAYDAPSGEPTPASVPLRGSSARLWIGAALLAIALAGAGILAYQQFIRPAAPPPPVVVLGGEVTTEDGQVARSKPSPTASNPGSESGSNPGSESGSDSGSESGSDSGSESGSDSGSGSRSGSQSKSGSDSGSRSSPPADPYRAALARYQRAFRACINDNATSVSGAPNLALALRLDAKGHVATAHLLPAELEATQLGTCVLAIARKVSFGPQDGELDVTIPLKIRRR
jgi:serine/threonine-protein kinase